MTDRPLRWGLIGTGGISTRFAADLRAAGLPIAAVASRRIDVAREFAERTGAARAHGSAAELVADPDVDVVYVGTPQAVHVEHALLAIDAGRPVLVEKAFALDAASAATVLDAARERGVFAMEALWTRFLPAMAALRRRIAEGAIGEVVEVHAAHHQSLDVSPTSRHGNPAAGGGVMLDLGIYPVQLAVDLLGEPEAVHATGARSDLGVDLRATALLGYPGGRAATVATSMVASGETRASVHGTDGSIALDPWWFAGTGWTRYDAGRPAIPVERCEGRVLGAPGPSGMEHEALEVQRCVREGLLESPVMPHADTLAGLRVCERVLAAVA